MMTRLLALSVLLLSLALTELPSRSLAENTENVFTPSFTVPDVDPSYYFKTVETLKKKDPATLDRIDFLKFRRAYLAARDKNNLTIPSELESEYKELLSQEDPDPDAVVELCDKILALDFTDINRHIIRNYFLEQKGEDVSFYRDLTSRLIGSILDSGDGNTPETALHVFQVKEEYEVLKMYRLELVDQSLVHAGDHSFDLLKCQDAEGKTYAIYFDITEHMQSIQDSLQSANEQL